MLFVILLQLQWFGKLCEERFHPHWGENKLDSSGIVSLICCWWPVWGERVFIRASQKMSMQQMFEARLAGDEAQGLARAAIVTFLTQQVPVHVVHPEQGETTGEVEDTLPATPVQEHRAYAPSHQGPGRYRGGRAAVTLVAIHR